MIGSMKEDANFFVGQKAFIRKGNEILVIFDPIEGLDFPGGKIQEGEIDIESSLKREVREETKLEVSVKNPFCTWIKVMPPQHRHAGKPVFLVAYNCDYVSGTIELSEEHNNFKWVNKDTYKTVDDGTSFFDILEKYFNQ